MRKTILVADHSQAYLKHIANILRKMGFKVLPLEKSFEILKCLREKHADLIMIDEDVSKGHIPEILDWLKQNSNTQGIPVLIVSSHPQKEMAALCKEHGCAEYIPKPTNLEMLHKILQDNIYGPLGYVRRHMRVNYQNQISVIYKDESYNYMLESLSEGGVYIATDEPLPVDAEVEVFLELENNFVLDLMGRVIYTNEFKPKESHIPMGMAVQFLEGNEDKMHVITDFVKGLLISPT